MINRKQDEEKVSDEGWAYLLDQCNIAGQSRIVGPEKMVLLHCPSKTFFQYISAE